MGFQQPVAAAGKTIDLFGLKAYVMNVAAISLGFKGSDRKKPPLPAPPPQEAAPEDISKATIKQSSVMSFGEQCCNQLDRAAYLYGDPDNFYNMRLLVNVLGSTAEWHGRRSIGNSEIGGGGSRNFPQQLQIKAGLCWPHVSGPTGGPPRRGVSGPGAARGPREGHEAVPRLAQEGPKAGARAVFGAT